MAEDVGYLPATTTEDRLPFETWNDTRTGPRSFYGAPLCPNIDDLDAQIAFLGIPFDLAIGRPGQRFAPNSIRDTGGAPGVYSCGSPDGSMTFSGYYDIDADRQFLSGVTMADCGDVPIMWADIERNFWRITRAVRRIVSKGSLLVAVGGDNSITAPVVRGFEAYRKLDIVHLDAHSDYIDQVEGIRWSAGSAIRRASEFGWVDNITQIGLRASSRSRDIIDAARARGNRIVTTDQFRAMGPEAAIAQVPESDAIYVDIDIDIMDPSICPGVSAVAPGGLTYPEMRAALQALTRRGRIVGIDLVEVSPPLDPTGHTSKTASQLLIDFLAAITDQQ